MIEQHMGVWLWQGPAPGESMHDHMGLLAFNALGGGAAPTFVTLAGIGSCLLARKREGRGDNPDRALVLRGLVVMAFGYLLSLMTPSWFSPRAWFVLHLMGLGMLTTPLWRRLPTAALLGIGVAILLATGPLQAWVGVPLHMDNPYMAGRSPISPHDWVGLRIALLEGQFPVFPWFSFYLAGIVVGRHVSDGRLRRTAALAGGALALGLVGVASRYLVPAAKGGALWRTTTLNVPFFPASPTLVVLLLAIVLLGIFALMVWDDRRPLSENNPLVTLGRASLTLLLLHVWLFRELTRVDGWWQLHVPPLAWLSRWTHWWQALSVGESLSLLLGFVVFAVVATRLWQRVDYRYGAEWALRKLAP
ncbi:MAG: DUF418 domain-containing transporter [Myxococcales bacterium]|nr:DUF418 domain-containing transporter [Myxococcales bacterium]